MVKPKAAKGKQSTAKARGSTKSKQRLKDGSAKSDASSNSKRANKASPSPSKSKASSSNASRKSPNPTPSKASPARTSKAKAKSDASSNSKRANKASPSPSKSKASSSNASRESPNPTPSKASPACTSKAKSVTSSPKATSSAIAVAQPNADNSAKARKSKSKQLKKQSGNDGFATPTSKGTRAEKKSPPTASTVASETSEKSLVRRSLKNSLNLEGKRVVDGSKKIKKTTTNVVKLQSHQIDWHQEGGETGVDFACKTLVEGLGDLSPEEIRDMARAKKVDILLDVFSPKALSYGFIPLAMKLGVDFSTVDMHSAFATKQSSKSTYTDFLQRWRSKQIEVVDSDESTSDKKK